MTRCLLGIGANLGNPSRQIAAAVERLAERRDVRVEAVSRNVTSPAVGGPPGQPSYLNAAVLMETSLAPRDVLQLIADIEQSLGRTPSTRWDARLIDIDLLLYGDAILREAGLRIPHPWMVARAFVLQPAAEIAPDLRHPLVGWPIARLWQHLKFTPPRFALVGADAPGLLQQLALQVSAVMPNARLVPPARHAISPKADLSEQLECLSERTELLRIHQWNEATDDQPRISSFWLDEALVEAKASLVPEQFEQFERAFAVTERLNSPAKLVILATGYWSAAGRPNALSPIDRLELMRHQLTVRDVAPWIEIESTQPDDFVRELVGAMLAMQPPTEPVR